MTEEATNELEKLTLDNTDPDKHYFVYFIHELGRRGEKMPIKVGASNDVPAYRKSLEGGREKGLKTHSAILCRTGDAQQVVERFTTANADKHLQNGWYKGGKELVDAFAEELVKGGYEKTTEGRARLLKGGRKPAAKK